MSRSFLTQATFDPTRSDRVGALADLMRRILPLVQRDFDVEAVLVMRPEPPTIRKWPIDEFVHTSGLADWGDEVLGLSATMWMPNHGDSSSADLEIPAYWADRVDKSLPPGMERMLSARFDWDSGFWAERFKEPQFASAYARLLEAIRDELDPVRMVHGPSVFHWEDEADLAHFIYYRDPVEFVRVFYLLQGLEGDPGAAVRALREISERDELTKILYVKRPHAESWERTGKAKRYKRLRLTEKGGIIFEDGRYGVKADDLGLTAYGLQPYLAELLIKEGAAKRVGPGLRPPPTP